MASSEFDDFLFVTVKDSNVAIISTLKEEELLFHIDSILERIRQTNFNKDKKAISYEE